MNQRKINIWLDVFSFLIILMFVYTATSKIIEWKTYQGEINNQPFDNKYTPFLTRILPGSEYLVALLLLFKRTRFAGFLLSTFLMILFTGYITLVLSRYYGRIPCSCGGALKNLNWWQHLGFNVFYLFISSLGSIWLWKRSRNKGRGNEISRDSQRRSPSYGRKTECITDQRNEPSNYYRDSVHLYDKTTPKQ